MPVNDRSAEHSLRPIEGSPPDLFHPPIGCGYCARCPHAMKVCEENAPEPFAMGDGHTTRCWLHHEATPHQVAGLHYREANA
jgi:oligopeptide/dipeptide ABC transporter ATP-binding protein